MSTTTRATKQSRLYDEDYQVLSKRSKLTRQPIPFIIHELVLLGKKHKKL